MHYPTRQGEHEDINRAVVAARQAVALRANNSIYGLAGIWTSDVKKVDRTAALLKAGVVWVNTYNQFDAAAPFGGYKQSGYGREMGHAALDTYTQAKTVGVSLQ